MVRLTTLALLPVLALASPAFAADGEKAKEADPARQKASEKRFARLKDYLKEKRVSHVVELLAEWGEFADANQQDDVLKWVADLREHDDVAPFGREPFKKIGYRGVKATAEVGKDELPSAFFVDEFSRLPPPTKWRWNEVVGAQLIVASKTFVARSNNETVHRCVVLTNADVAEFQGIDGCLVISSGSVKVFRQMDRGVIESAVICRGDVEFVFDRPPDRVQVRAGGTITDVNPVVKRRLKPEEIGFVEKDDKLLGFKFYSCIEDGLTAKADKGVVTVSKVDAKKPFAKAGVKDGDVIEAINGEKVPSLHELDRLLCRATVASGVAKLTVKRGDKSEVIEVKLADW
jgi:hypothetical protein